MSNIECGPFNGIWDKIGSQHASADSCVGVLRGTGRVVKWSRERPSDRDDLWAICQFLKRSNILYRAALGDEYIVPSVFVASQKKNGRGLEYKPYIIQPHIDCWTGKSLPNEYRSSRVISDSWAVLYSRLYYLYQTAEKVNHRYEEANRFPITITVGSTRQIVKEDPGSENVISLPRTDNILIEKSSKRLLLCDFGEYRRWDDSMEVAYQRIMSRIERRIK